MPGIHGYQRFFADMKRRRVFRVMAVYGAVAFGLIQVVDVVLPRMGLPDWTVTLVVWLSMLGFPAAVVLAWAFDLTPQGLRRTDEAETAELDEIVAEPAGRRWSSGLLALLGILALVTGAWWAGRSTASGEVGVPVRSANAAEVLDRAYADMATDPRPAVAVLPFVDMSPRGDQGYFADGMSEEILNALAKVRGLRVAGRTSSFAFRNVEMDLRRIGRELGVRYLVEGSVRKQGDRLRITAQLVDADGDFHLWSNAYDRTLDDVFAVQEEIAEAVAAQLQVSLGLEAGGTLVAPTGDLAAYDLYLRAKARMRERGDGVREAVELFREVVARDSTWAPGWAGLAQAYTLVPYYAPAARRPTGIAPEAWASALDSATAAATDALSLDPRVAGADVALGSAYRDRWMWTKAEEHYLRALEIDPDDVEAHQQYAELLAATGREDEALRSARRAAVLDPTSAIRLNELAWMLYLNGRPDDALAQVRLAAAHDPELALVYQTQSQFRLGTGDLDAAEKFWREEYVPRLGLDPETNAAWDRTAAERFAALRGRDTAAYAACCARFNAAADWALLGDTARTIDALRDGYLGRPKFGVDAMYGVWIPDLDPIRGDPRFEKVLNEILEYAGLSGATLRRAPATE